MSNIFKIPIIACLICTFLLLIIKETPFILDDVFVNIVFIGIVLYIVIIYPFYITAYLFFRNHKNLIGLIIACLNICIAVFMNFYLIKVNIGEIHFDKEITQKYVATFLIGGSIITYIGLAIRFKKIIKT